MQRPNFRKKIKIRNGFCVVILLFDDGLLHTENPVKSNVDV